MALSSRRQVSNWLSAGILMIIVQILLGGITRLTGSGLSITEWKPLMGALPPLNQFEWLQSFGKYQEIAQFKKLNHQFTLGDYQAIYFWEWLHREWARLMGLVFLVPLLIFYWQGKLSRQLYQPLAGLFLLGALQGMAGWLMVKSGLNDTATRVSHIRLAVHFCLALLTLLYLYRMQLAVRPGGRPGYVPPIFRLFTLMVLGVFALQLVYGAFMAGTHAALYAPTWPDINGQFFMFTPGLSGPWWQRAVIDPLLIQFIHRMLAYLLILLLLSWFIFAGLLPLYTPIRRLRGYPLIFLIIQAALGIAALRLSGTPSYLLISVLHQLNAVLLLLCLAHIYFRSSTRAS